MDFRLRCWVIHESWAKLATIPSITRNITDTTAAFDEEELIQNILLDDEVNFFESEDGNDDYDDYDDVIDDDDEYEEIEGEIISSSSFEHREEQFLQEIFTPTAQPTSSPYPTFSDPNQPTPLMIDSRVAWIIAQVSEIVDFTGYILDSTYSHIFLFRLYRVSQTFCVSTESPTQSPSESPSESPTPGPTPRPSQPPTPAPTPPPPTSSPTVPLVTPQPTLPRTQRPTTLEPTPCIDDDFYDDDYPGKGKGKGKGLCGKGKGKGKGTKSKGSKSKGSKSKGYKSKGCKSKGKGAYYGKGYKGKGKGYKGKGYHEAYYLGGDALNTILEERTGNDYSYSNGTDTNSTETFNSSIEERNGETYTAGYYCDSY